MKATGSVLYLNFKFLITTNFSNFEMLYYEKFVTNMTSPEERIKYRNLWDRFVARHSSLLLLCRTDVLSLLEITPRIAWWFYIVLVELDFCFVSFCKTGSLCIIRVGLEPIILHPTSSVIGPLASISRPCYSLQKEWSRHTGDEPIT